LYPVPEFAAAVDARWLCLECHERFDQAAASAVAAAEARARAAKLRARPDIPDEHEQGTLGEVTRE